MSVRQRPGQAANSSGRVPAATPTPQPRHAGGRRFPPATDDASRVPQASYPIQYPRVTLPPVPAAQDVERFGRRHRKAIVWAIVSLLAGTGITAVAVAPLVPDAAQLPQRVLTEVVVPTGLQSQLDALAAQELTLTRSDITRVAGPEISGSVSGKKASPRPRSAKE